MTVTECFEFGLKTGTELFEIVNNAAGKGVPNTMQQMQNCRKDEPLGIASA